MKDTMKISDDKRLATLAVSPGPYTTAQLERLIGRLAELRAHMSPEVPLQQPEPTDETNVLLQDNPYFGVAVHRNGKLYIWARNMGIGWLLFRIPAAKVPGIRDYLVANVLGDGEGSLFSSSRDEGGRH